MFPIRGPGPILGHSCSFATGLQDVPSVVLCNTDQPALDSTTNINWCLVYRGFLASWPTVWSVIFILDKNLANYCTYCTFPLVLPVFPWLDPEICLKQLQRCSISTKTTEPSLVSSFTLKPTTTVDHVDHFIFFLFFFCFFFLRFLTGVHKSHIS